MFSRRLFSTNYKHAQHFASSIKYFISWHNIEMENWGIGGRDNVTKYVIEISHQVNLGGAMLLLLSKYGIKKVCPSEGWGIKIR